MACLQELQSPEHADNVHLSLQNQDKDKMGRLFSVHFRTPDPPPFLACYIPRHVEEPLPRGSSLFLPLTLFFFFLIYWYNRLKSIKYEVWQKAKSIRPLNFVPSIGSSVLNFWVVLLVFGSFLPTVSFFDRAPLQ